MYLIKTILIVGLGSIGRRHIGVIQSIFPDINIVVLRHDQCKNNDIKALGLYRCVTSINEAIALNPQAAIISNPASKHVEVAKILAKKGISLLIEKPISDSLKGVQELIDICHKNRSVLMTGYNLRFLPSLIDFKKNILSKKIGKIYSVRSEIGQYLPSWRPGSDYRDGVSAKRKMGGGVLLELSHEIDYLSWIFGRIDWVKSHVSRQSDLEIDVEDSAQVILGFESVDDTQLTASLNIDFIRHDMTRKCFAIGEYGTLLWDGIKGRVEFFEKDRTQVQWEVLHSSKPDRNFTYMKEIEHFFSSVENGMAPSISGVVGLKVVGIVENIKEASHTNSIVFCQK